MDADTLKALKESIAKWQRNSRVRKPESYTTGVKDCPLCLLFFHKGCVGCPVSEATGRDQCRHTPYDDACRAKSLWRLNPHDVADARDARKFARDEVAFLQSLLPEEA